MLYALKTKSLLSGLASFDDFGLSCAQTKALATSVGANQRALLSFARHCRFVDPWNLRFGFEASARPTSGACIL